MTAAELSMDARMQRMEQAILGIGTNNGLLRSVHAIQEDVAATRRELHQGFDRIETALARETAERKEADLIEAASRSEADASAREQWRRDWTTTVRWGIATALVAAGLMATLLSELIR